MRLQALDTFADHVSEVRASGSPVEISCASAWPLCNGLEDSLFNFVGVLVEVHVPEHHDRGQHKGCWVCKIFPGNIRRCPMHRLKNGHAFLPNVATWSETKTTNETCGEIAENITIQVGHHHHIKLVRVLCDHQARLVEKLLIKMHIWILLRNLSAAFKKQPIRHFHHIGLVHGSDTITVVLLCKFKSKLSNAHGRLLCDQFDGLDHSWDHLVLNPTVFPFGVFTNNHCVHIIIGRLVSLDGSARTNVCKQVKGFSKSEIQRWMSLANGCSKRALECNFVLKDGLFCHLRYGRTTILVKGGHHIHILPFNRRLCSSEDLLYCL
eukprot:m.4898 g.4898  ORF g.4898 m.4898 type:complete len:323 (-) comp4051_c0_seq1:176-1144(-)